jgi:hypothetical protein
MHTRDLNSSTFQKGLLRFFWISILCVTFSFIVNGQSPGNVMFQPLIGEEKILFIRVIYPDDTTAILSDDMAAQHAQNLATLLETNSYGQYTVDIDITPQLMMPQPSTFYELENRLSFVRLRADAIRAAEEAGFPESNYDREGIFTKHIWPQTFTGVGGVNRRTYYSTLNNVVLSAHELGHTFDWRHASFWRVTSSNPLDSNGTLIEYGDKFDNMGDAHGINGPHHFSPWYKTRADWIPIKNILTVTESGNYIIQGLELMPQPDPVVSSYSALRVRRNSVESYFIFYRSQEASANTGALITRVQPRNGSHSTLLDMHPFSVPEQNQDYLDAALQPGETAFDPVAGIAFSVLEQNADSLLVHVTVPDTVMPRLPAINFISPSWTLGSLQGDILYEVTAFDPDVEAVNGAGIDSVFLVLGYPEGEDPFGEGTTFIPMVDSIYTAPPYVLEIDSRLMPDESYRLIAIAKTQDGKQNLAVFNHIIDNTGPSTMTAIHEAGNENQAHVVIEAFPNPFSGSTTIAFSLHSGSEAELYVYNLWGQIVRVFSPLHMTSESVLIEWDGLDLSGNPVPNGIYYCQLRMGQQRVSRPLVLMRFK